MNIFGVGTWEMLVIVIGALLIFGPGRLPEVLGQLGKFVRDARKMTADLTSEFERAVGNPNDIKAALNKELSDVKTTVSGTTATVKREVNQVSTTVNKAVGSTTKSTTSTGARSTAAKASTSAAKASTTAAKSATSSATAAPKPLPAKATKADPLADLMLIDPDEVAPAPARPVAAVRTAQSAPPVVATPKATPAKPAPNGANGAASSIGGDPLARARQRRACATYGQGSPGRQATASQS